MKEVADFGKTILKILSYENSLTKKEMIVADYVKKNANEIIYLSVTELAEKANVGETTILRFCKKMKFSGFQDFKLSLAQDMAQTNEELYESIEENDHADALIRKVTNSHIRIAEETRSLLEPENVDQAIQMILNAEKIYFFGVGSSGLTAIQAAQSFVRIGKPSYANQDTHFQSIGASLMTDKDVAIGISVSGSTKDTNESLQIAKNMGANVICITHNARSPITKLSDVDLIMAAWENPLRGSSLSATISQTIVIDLLFIGVFMKMKEKAIEYRNRTAKAVSEKLY